MRSAKEQQVERLTKLMAYLALCAPDGFPGSKPSGQPLALVRCFAKLRVEISALTHTEGASQVTFELEHCLEQSFHEFRREDVHSGLAWLQCLQNTIIDHFGHGRLTGQA